MLLEDIKRFVYYFMRRNIYDLLTITYHASSCAHSATGWLYFRPLCPSQATILDGFILCYLSEGVSKKWMGVDECPV